MLSDHSGMTPALKWIARGLLRMVDRPLPAPDCEEVRLVEQLREGFVELSMSDGDDLAAGSREWAANSRRLYDLVAAEDPRQFLRWDVIRETMFVTHAAYTWRELRYLKCRGDWSVRWRNALRESRVGHPVPLLFYPSTSGNLLHHAYHLARFEEATGRRCDEFEQIIEFGGGYGSMCRLFYNLGFKGRYIVYDLPALSNLQEYYLSALGFKVGRTISAPAPVICVSNPNEFLQHAAGGTTKNSLFVATWSMSETGLDERGSIEGMLSKCAAFLIAFQEQFGGVHNTTYFDRLTRRLTDVDWRHERIGHLPGNCYLFGRRKHDEPEMASSVGARATPV